VTQDFTTTTHHPLNQKEEEEEDLPIPYELHSDASLEEYEKYMLGMDEEDYKSLWVDKCVKEKSSNDSNKVWYQ